MGLIGGILQPLFAGFPVTLMSPQIMVQHPVRWLGAISRYKATTSGGPSVAYELCLRRVAPELRTALDLGSWRVAFNGAEPVHHETLERFATFFAPCGFRREAFYPCYGLAEATLMVSGGEKAARPVIYQVSASALERHRVVGITPPQEGGRVHPHLSWSRATSRVHLTKVAWRPRPAVALTVFRGCHVTPRHSKPNAGSASRAGPKVDVFSEGNRCAAPAGDW
jgi:acyl-CoA synthetase (AMP-forming)/AMP-acid ligase II